MATNTLKAQKISGSVNGAAAPVPPVKASTALADQYSALRAALIPPKGITGSAWTTALRVLASQETALADAVSKVRALPDDASNRAGWPGVPGGSISPTALRASLLGTARADATALEHAVLIGAGLRKAAK